MWCCCCDDLIVWFDLEDVESEVRVVCSDTEEDDEMMEAAVSAVEPLLDLSVRDGGLYDREIVRRCSGAPSSLVRMLRACNVGIGNGFSTDRSCTVFGMGGSGSKNKNLA